MSMKTLQIRKLISTSYSNLFPIKRCASDCTPLQLHSFKDEILWPSIAECSTAFSISTPRPDRRRLEKLSATLFCRLIAKSPWMHAEILKWCGKELKIYEKIFHFARPSVENFRKTRKREKRFSIERARLREARGGRTSGAKHSLPAEHGEVYAGWW